MPRRNGGKKGKRIIQDPGMWPELAGCSGLVLGARAEAQWVTKPQNDSKMMQIKPVAHRRGH